MENRDYEALFPELSRHCDVAELIVMLRGDPDHGVVISPFDGEPLNATAVVNELCLASVVSGIPLRIHYSPDSDEVAACVMRPFTLLWLRWLPHRIRYLAWYVPKYQSHALRWTGRIVQGIALALLLLFVLRLG